MNLLSDSLELSDVENDIGYAFTGKVLPSPTVCYQFNNNTKDCITENDLKIKNVKFDRDGKFGSCIYSGDTGKFRNNWFGNDKSIKSDFTLSFWFNSYSKEQDPNSYFYLYIDGQILPAITIKISADNKYTINLSNSTEGKVIGTNKRKKDFQNFVLVADKEKKEFRIYIDGIKLNKINFNKVKDVKFFNNARIKFEGDKRIGINDFCIWNNYVLTENQINILSQGFLPVYNLM